MSCVLFMSFTMQKYNIFRNWKNKLLILNIFNILSRTI